VNNKETVSTYNLLAAKYDGVVYRVFTNNILLEDDNEKAIFYSKCGSDFLNVRTQTRCSSTCDEFIVMLKQEHYNIVILLNGNGLVEYYINLTLIPETVSSNAMKFVDMDIDLSFTSGNRVVEVLDCDEFEHNSLFYNYSAGDKHVINYTVENLKNKVAADDYYLSEAFVAYCRELLTKKL
jgi:protein associated with RNAse G/E